jgi:hypothetical protein
MATAGTNTGNGELYGVQWVPCGRWDVKTGPLVAFEKVDLDEVWRYLGMIQDGDVNCEHMVEQLRLRVGEAAEVLSRKKISLAGAICLSSVVIMPSAMYRLKLSSATDEQIDQIQSPLRQVIAKKAHITAAHTNVLFGGYAWNVGGNGGAMKPA